MTDNPVSSPATRARRRQRSVLPPDKATSRPLLMAIAVMCFLATLAGISVTMMNDAADRWTSGIEGSATIQLPPASAGTEDAAALDSQVTRVLAILKKTPGIVAMHAFTREESSTLLEPWLGENISPDLPIPQLIDVTLDRAVPPDLAVLSRELEAAVPGAIVDDHTQWNDRILVFADLWRAMALSALALIVLCTAAIVTFATRSSLAAKHEIVDVLHLIGAHDRFIAREFQRQFLWIGLKGSLIGVAVALASVALLAAVAQSYLGPEGTYLLPVDMIDERYALALVLIPAAISLVIAMTTQATVLRAIAKSL